MENQVYAKKKILFGIVVFLLFINLIGNVAYAFSRYNDVEFSDFSRRYRESSYVAEGINPFDVVYGNEPVDPQIGELPRNSGYPAWSMVIGIITNFTMFSESLATKLTLLVMAAGVIVTGLMLKKYADQQHWGEEYKWILVLSGIGIYGFWTGFSFLNFGSVIGVLLFIFVLFKGENHSIWGGILMGVASIKPVLAAPFFLALFLRKKWKTALVGGGIACLSWGIASILTGTSPLDYLAAMAEEGNTYWNNSFFASIAAVFNVQLETKPSNFLSALLCIGIAVGLWVILLTAEREKISKWIYYGIPAVLSGCWMYSQEHDRTVMLIFLVALLNELKQTDDVTLKHLLVTVTASVVIGREVVMRYLGILLDISVEYRAVDFIFRVLWIIGLITLVLSERYRQQSEVSRQ